MFSNCFRNYNCTGGSHYRKKFSSSRLYWVVLESLIQYALQQGQAGHLFFSGQNTWGLISQWSLQIQVLCPVTNRGVCGWFHWGIVLCFWRTLTGDIILTVCNHISQNISGANRSVLDGRFGIILLPLKRYKGPVCFQKNSWTGEASWLEVKRH